MKAEQVDKALCQKFLTDEQRLVFWHDPDEEFAEYISGGLPDALAAVTVVDVATTGGLPTKLLLERKHSHKAEDPAAKYLLYRSGDRPSVDQDWLLDIRLYSAEFRADIASLWLEELGLTTLSLRDHLRQRRRFLGSQERRKRLARLLGTEAGSHNDDDTATIDRKMMAVVAGSALPDLFSILRAICHGHLSGGARGRGDEPGDGDSNPFDEAPKVLETLSKMDLSDGFWAEVLATFGYNDAKPSIAGLLRHLFASELMHNTGPVDAFAPFQLPPAGLQNTIVFLTQWRDSSQAVSSYDVAAMAVAEDLKVLEHLRPLKLAELSAVFTFWQAERCVVSDLKGRVLADKQAIDVAFVADLAHQRQAGHWLAGPGENLPERQAISAAYDAIVAAAELFALQRETDLQFDDPEALLTAYQRDLYRFDRCYRRFHTQARPAEAQNWELLKALAAEVERVYDEGFLQPLGLRWSQMLDGANSSAAGSEEPGFLGSWRIPGMTSQHRFYAKHIAPQLKGAHKRRAFVIISDAFRYEAAVELTETLNGRSGVSAKLSAMLGVLPSYTTLGMASLLPHDTLAYAPGGSADVFVDGKSVASTALRNKHLATVAKGMACQAEQLRGMRNDEARASTADKDVVYIYHNVIDARGDSASTESETFEAVAQCIDELAGLVHFCTSKLGASRVWVTADHGFLYQQTAPDLTDRSNLTHKPSNTVKMKKRYVIGRGLTATPEAHLGNTRITAGTQDDMGFWIPRGSNRFHFVGGARFVHGGAMPQEIVVPLVEVTQLRGASKKASRVQKVGVQVLGAHHKITAPIHRFELLQTEPVGDRRKPITLRAAVYEGAKAVTSVETVTFDSTSASMDERKRTLRLTLANAAYDKRTEYRLVLRDAETQAEVQSIVVVIDRSFTDDF